MKSTKLKKALNKVDVSRKISNHLVGENHSLGHRMIIGAVIIFGGVAIAAVGHGEQWLFAYLIDGTGYLIHAMGAVPYIEWFITLGEDDDHPKESSKDSFFNDENLLGNRKN